MDESAAISLLQIHLDEHSYNQFIGRNLNFRFDDGSSINKSPIADKYKSRQNEVIPENVPIVIDKLGWYFPFIIHEGLPHIEIYFKAFKGLKWIELVRHPIDLVHSWYKRKLVNRFGEDPLAFIPTLKGKKAIFLVRLILFIKIMKTYVIWIKLSP